MIPVPVYVLIVVFARSLSSDAGVATLERSFDSKAACIAAATAVKQQALENHLQVPVMVCVEGGA